MKKTGFTLAEVLITLAIIGVVSALTVPGLMNSYQKQTYVTQLHKVYNEMSQALIQYQTDRNALNLTEAGLTSIDAFDTFIKTYFKVVNDCGTTSTPCFVSEYKKLSGTTINFSSTFRKVTLANGASIAYNTRSDTAVLQFHVDVNGAKGPNIIGRDLFPIYIYNNGMLDDYYSATTNAPLTSAERESMYTASCASTNASWNGCFGKILNDNWQMNY